MNSLVLLCQFFMFVAYELCNAGLVLGQAYVLDLWLHGHYFTYLWELVRQNRWHYFYNEAIHPTNVS